MEPGDHPQYQWYHRALSSARRQLARTVLPQALQNYVRRSAAYCHVAQTSRTKTKKGIALANKNFKQIPFKFVISNINLTLCQIFIA